MPNYLTKEEIRQWRSSLEKITLEEFAARLGKEVEEKKPTNDVVDIVMSNGTSSNTGKDINDGFSRIAERAFERERQISHTPFSISKRDYAEGSKADNLNTQVKKESSIGEAVKKILKEQSNSSENTTQKDISKESVQSQPKKQVQIVLKKSLTDREQAVLDYLVAHVGETVFAKDLAVLLDLPRDYVYKYIKNLRAKIEGDKLKNVPSGGFVLTE